MMQLVGDCIRIVMKCEQQAHQLLTVNQMTEKDVSVTLPTRLERQNAAANGQPAAA